MNKSCHLFACLFVFLIFTATGFAADIKLKFHRFTHQPATVGLQTNKTIDLNLSLTTFVNDAILSKTDLTQQQVCNITILEIAEKKIKKVSIAYQKSSRKQTKDKRTQSVEDPVTGKTYTVLNENGKLTITNAATNQLPTPREIAIIQSNLSSLGKPNPLAKTLNGKFCYEGQTIVMPKLLAKEMFGKQAFSKVASDVDFKFESVKIINGKKCAVLTATLDNKQAIATAKLTGTFIVEINTCRTISADFDGPISSDQNNKKGNFNLKRRGTVRISMTANYSKKR